MVGGGRKRRETAGSTGSGSGAEQEEGRGRKEARAAAGGSGSGRDAAKAERGWQEAERVAESGTSWREAVGGCREPDGQGDTRNSIKGLAGEIIEPKTILLEFIIAPPIALVRQNAFY